MTLPSATDEHAYALEISGDALRPAYRDGDVLVVSPDTPIRRGDRVVVKTSDGDMMVGELKRRTARTLELQALDSGQADRTLVAAEIAWVARNHMGETIMTAEAAPDVLQDLLRDSLDVVLCGTAVGTASAVAGAYYAHKQNKFWKILYETGLTPELMQPRQYRDLLQHRIGLTDFVKTHREWIIRFRLQNWRRLPAPACAYRSRSFGRPSWPSPARPAGSDSRRQPGLRRTNRANRRHPDLDPALDLGRRQRQLAPGNLARLRRESEGGGWMSGYYRCGRHRNESLGRHSPSLPGLTRQSVN